MEELLSLKWNNHRSTFLHILTILRDKQLYTDATLACEGRFYSVHRLVLSTCSDYFSAMFDRTTCKNPIIVLKDIKCEDLEALLDYMYLGEVNVRQADLASLIKAAECLRVKGLAVPDDEPPPKRGRGDTNFRKPDSAGSPPSKRKRREEGTQDGREDIRPAPAQPKVGSQSQASRLSPGPQDPSDSSKLQPQTTSSSSADMLQPNNVPQSDEQQSPFVKVEMEDSGGDDMGGGGVGADNSFNMNNDSFKEEASEDHVGDLSNDLPEFLQQSTDGSYSHSFAGPSFQPDLPNWQGDQVLSSNNFSGLGFPSQSQDGSQNTGTSGNSGNSALNLQSLMALSLPPLSRPYSGICLPNDDASSMGGAGSTPDGGAGCVYCGKTFNGRNKKQDLERHVMTHTGEKPFRCPYCPHRTNRSCSLLVHIRGIHREQKLQ